MSCLLTIILWQTSLTKKKMCSLCHLSKNKISIIIGLTLVDFKIWMFVLPCLTTFLKLLWTTQWFLASSWVKVVVAFEGFWIKKSFFFFLSLLIYVSCLFRFGLVRLICTLWNYDPRFFLLLNLNLPLLFSHSQIINRCKHIYKHTCTSVWISGMTS